MNRRLVALLICVVAGVGLSGQGRLNPTPVQTIPAPVWQAGVYGTGAATCAQWTATVKTGDSASYISWVQGYASGIAAATAPLGGRVDAQYVMGSLNGFCATNPTLTIAAAADGLVKQTRLINTVQPR